jgi:CheY-like chemotaxis protein
LAAIALYKIHTIAGRLGKGNVDFGADENDIDELYERAKKEVIRAGRASTSLLQRRLRIGYGRAARLIDMLEAGGVIGPAKGSAPRLVNVPQKVKLLVVTDDSVIADDMKEQFEQAGYKVVTRSNANSDFVERVMRIKPDLISLDELMPGRTGLEALQLLQQDERTKQIPVMAFGNVGDSSAIECVKHGAVDYHLLSEVTTDELVDAYSEYLDDPENYSPRVASML